MRILLLEVIFVNVGLLCARTLPTVKPGLFVIHGVHTCGKGEGFCLLGRDCTVNEEFLSDPDGHCTGLRSAFIPQSHFSCCRYVPHNSTFDEFGTDQPPTSTLADDENPTVAGTVGSLAENSASSWMGTHFERGDATEQPLQEETEDSRASQVKQAGANHRESILQESHSDVDIPASDDNTLHMESANTTDPGASAISTSNSTTDLKFPETGLIDIEKTEEGDSTHSLQSLELPHKNGQDPLKLGKIGDEELEPRGVTSSPQMPINHLGCTHDIHTDSDSPVFERLENFDTPEESSSSRDYAKDINDHKHERSPAQWFRISRRLDRIRPTATSLLNSVDDAKVVPTSETNASSIIAITVPEELKGTPLTSPPEQCWAFPNADESAPRCLSVWKFVLNDAILCFGTLVNSVWVLTSASCITKIYDNDLEKVMVTDIEGKSGLHAISTMIVHENFKIGHLNELNDIGLISLNDPTDSSCFVCFSNEEKKYSDKMCSTYVLTSNRINEGTLEKCEDRVKVLNIHSKVYLSLLCPTRDDSRQLVDNSSANILWCEDSLVGLETTYENGLFIFTPAFEHAEWILKNIQQYL